MKILYGVVGEGMGHAMRSSVVLDRLKKAGHEVRIVVSGRAAEYLEKRHPGTVTRITGLTMVYEDNVVRKFKTAIKNLKAAAGIPENLSAYLEMARSFTPDAVISDFESWSYAFARGQKIPVISVDNMQVIDRCVHEPQIFGDDKASFLLAKSIVKAKLPRANAYLITTFFYPPARKERTTLHPPILRDIILEARGRARPGGHVLVYQSGASHESLIEALKRVDAPFRVYGLKRDITSEEVEGNLTHCPFSDTKFIDDLASARAVIAGGGFTLLGEALSLKKPVLSVPLVGQFEQTINAIYLTKLGYGELAEEITPDGVRRFLGNAGRYAENLSAFSHDANAGLFARLEEALAQALSEGARA
jgi:uncharacterized protein (TIGR00661 family)